MPVEGLRDIKGPVYFPVNYFFIILIAVLLALFLLALAVRYFLKKRKNPPKKVIKSAHQLAYEALEALRARNLPASGKVKEFYFELSDIARHYLENRFTLRAPEMTTEEFLHTLGESTKLTDSHKALLKEFLNHCDLVKFAKYGPTRDEIDTSFKAARKLVDETKDAEGTEDE